MLQSMMDNMPQGHIIVRSEELTLFKESCPRWMDLPSDHDQS